MNWLRRRPIPEWRTNAADHLNILRLIYLGIVVEAHGFWWAMAVMLGGRLVLSLVDTLLTPNHTSNHTQENNQS